MSQIQDSEEEFYQYNGNNYHKDRYGKWFVSNSGYENLYVNGINEGDLRIKVGEMIENHELSNKDQFEFTDDYGTMKLTFWEDTKDIYNSKLSRKLKTPDTDNENDQSSDKPKMPDAIKKIAEQNKSSTTKNNNFPKGESGWFKYDSYALVTIEEYYEKRKENNMIRPLRPKEMTPTCFMVKGNDGVETVKIWIGEWVKPSS